MRWQHPDHGLMPPGDFIPLAERTGLIGPLTHYVLNAASSSAATGAKKAMSCRSRSTCPPGGYSTSTFLTRWPGC